MTTCKMVACCRCEKQLKAHLCEYTLQNKPKWEWIPICHECKYAIAVSYIDRSK